ncbi:3-keto-5-aminohexanoate cleavage protein [Pseudonocardia eucalypti]
MDTRIGLEDSFVMPDGSPAEDNAELVRTAVHRAAGPG